jgi:hypothetical protein
MASIWNYAKMADAVYSEAPNVAGWTRIDFQKSGSGLTDGFQGAAFKNGNEIVFAFKGTSQFRDVLADTKLALGMNTFQYSSAVDFVDDFKLVSGDNVSLCGHSLGGAIAQVVGNRRRLPFVTFNAPGVALVSRNVDEMIVGVGTGAIRALGTIASAVWHPIQAFQDIKSHSYRVKGVNFRLGMDVVGSTGVHYGKVIQIPYHGNAMDLVSKHKMTTFLGAIKDSDYCGVELDTLLS